MNPLSAFAALLIAVAASQASLLAGEGPESSDESAPRRIGPYEAITFDEAVLRDARFDERGSVYLQLQPASKGKQIVVKISNDYFASYRPWLDGSFELVSPAGQTKADHAWTDHVNTVANYIEYWMDGAVFLHLKRADL